MKRQIQVTQIIEVEIDETKFTPEFLAEFSGYMFEADLNDHFEYLAQMYARGIYDEFSTFLEGYGPPKEMGIKFKQIAQEEELAPRGSHRGLTFGQERTMNTDQAAQASPADIAENRRRCWKPGCDRTSRLEWCGWKYCLRHYWTNIIRDAGWPHALTKLRWTRLVRR